LDIPDKGEYILRLNETMAIRYSDGHQTCGDWVDERWTYEIKLSDMSLDEYEASLPEFDIKDGVLINARPKGEVAVVPEGVVEIGHKAFCETKIKEVVLPSTLKKISSFAFSDCRYLKQVTLPEGLEELGFYALSDTAIEEINFPRSLRYIDDSVFRGTPFLKRIKDDRFVILGERFLYLYNGYDDTVEVPDGVEVICSGAFTSRKPDDGYRFCTPKRIILQGSVKRIDEYAFKYVYGLREINLREDIDIAPTAFDQSGYKTNYEAFLADKGEKK
ncbi:MAG: leucine-rich repeat domain-containing protein, partial [Clostridia bacterium]|nr:leucine-rich repeat domain-containing protein [Clostridia bacterium]